MLTLSYAYELDYEFHKKFFREYNSPMTHDSPGRGGSGFPKRILVLVALLIGSGVIIYLALDRLYIIAAYAFGREMAVVMVAAGTIVILFLTLLGMGFGGGLEWAVSRRILIFKRKPVPGSGLDLFLKLMGYRFKDPVSQSSETVSDAMPPGVTMTDIEELLVIIGQRRRGGKKSLHSDEVQFRAVRDWMTMQSHGTSVTLQQFLEERFGVASETGMALVPNQTFYGWRKKFLEELEKHKQGQSK
jgi:hypothetical protein